MKHASKTPEKGRKTARTEGVTTVTVPMPIALRDELRAIAESEERELAPYLRIVLKAERDRRHAERDTSKGGRMAG